MSLPVLAINESMMLRTLRNAGYKIGFMVPFGSAGVKVPIDGGGLIIVSEATHPDGIDWLHASISYPSTMPTYADLATLHSAVFGRRRWSYQLFAPETSHVNIHPYALHLWGRADGRSVLPDFGAEIGSI